MEIKIKAVIYARVSSKEQELGNSLSAQLKLSRNYAEKLDYEVVKEFVVAESAKENGRQVFRDMFSFLQSHPEIKIIICEKVDRLLRGELTDRVDVDDLIKRHNKEIHFAKENFILSEESKSAQKLYYGIQAEFARFYLNNLSDEVKKAYEVMVENGKYPHPPPIGYKIKLENGIGIVDSAFAPFIKKAFELAAQGISQRNISNQLYEEGFRSRSGKRIGKSPISAILNNPFYYGNFLWKGKIHHGLHEPIISKELFDTAQVAMSPRSRKKGYKHNFTYAGGLLRCGDCGSGITAELQKGHIYYRCGKPKGAGRCKQPYLREEDLEAQLAEGISKVRIKEKQLKAIQVLLGESHKEEEEYHKASVRGLNARYEALKDKKDRLLDAYLERAIDKESYQAKVSELENELGTISQELSKHRQADEAFFREVENFLDIANHAPELFLSSRGELKRELAKLVFSNLILRDKKIEISFRFPFDLLVEYAQTQNVQGWKESNFRYSFWRAESYH